MFAIIILSAFTALLWFFAFIFLKTAKLNQTAKAIWVFIIILFPIIGSIAYFLIDPDNENIPETQNSVNSIS
jgi:hypothetical protein